jgi:ABC-2 type transport system permease protein
MNHRLISIIRKEFIQIWRDPRTLVIILIIPIVQLFLLGYSATSDIKNIQLAVFDQSRSAESRAFLESYQAADYFVVSHYLKSEDEARALIEKGDARAALIIPPDFSQRLADGEAQVSFILDGSDPTVRRLLQPD